MKWIIGLVVVAALGFFGFQYMSNNSTLEAENLATEAAAKAEEAAATAKASAEQALATAQESMPAGLDLSQFTDSASGIFSTLTDSVSGITDAESAKAALPAMTEARGTLDSLTNTLERLPDAAKGPIAGIVTGGLAALQPILEKTLALPGVGPVIEPVITPMMDKLASLAE